jgi:LysR family transcriptional regulator, low CO2-responsive transcriptional regulator
MLDLRSLTLKQLRALASTVQHGTVTDAAKALCVTPPAVTTQLKFLEKSVGSPIFDRSTEGFTPTEIGRELLQTALNIEKLIAGTRDRIQALQSGATGSVIFAAVSTSKYVAPSIVARFQNHHPNIRVKLVIGNRKEIIAGLQQNEYDLALMGRPPDHLPVVSDVLSDHPHILIAPAGHRLGSRDKILAEDLLEETFLAREPGSGTRLLMERFFEMIASGRTFDIVEMGTNETIKQAVMAGLGIAFISAHTCQAELAAGKLTALSVSGLPLIRQWFLTYRLDQTLTKAAEVFRAFTLAHRQELFPRLGLP